jgi:hypothetical protein
MQKKHGEFLEDGVNNMGTVRDIVLTYSIEASGYEERSVVFLTRSLTHFLRLFFSKWLSRLSGPVKFPRNPNHFP